MKPGHQHAAGRLTIGMRKILEQQEAKAQAGLERAAIYLVGKLKEDVSLPGPDPTKGVRPEERRRRERLLAARNITRRPSAPGEPPRLRTGTLRASIAYEPLDPLTYRVGTPLKYGFWLEWGTDRMEARPWLRPGLRRRIPDIKAIVMRAMK